MQPPHLVRVRVRVRVMEPNLVRVRGRGRVRVRVMEPPHLERGHVPSAEHAQGGAAHGLAQPRAR